MGKVVALRLKPAGGLAGETTGGLAGETTGGPADPLDEVLRTAAAARLDTDGWVRRFGHAIADSFRRSYGPERARRHGRIFVEAMREGLGI